jgi:hypothetical protein
MFQPQGSGFVPQELPTVDVVANPPDIGARRLLENSAFLLLDFSRHRRGLLKNKISNQKQTGTGFERKMPFWALQIYDPRVQNPARILSDLCRNSKPEPVTD